MEKHVFLLHALGAGLDVDQSFEDGEDVAAVFGHAGEDIAQGGFALGLTMPFEQHRLRNFNIAAEFFGGVAAQEQAVEEGRLPLRVVKVVLGLFDRVGRGWKCRVGFSLHHRLDTKGAVYRKFARRQIVREYKDGE